MIIYVNTTGGTQVYRDTTALGTLRMDSTADTGNLMQIMRDAVIVYSSSFGLGSEDKIPELPRGTIEAVASR